VLVNLFFAPLEKGSTPIKVASNPYKLLAHYLQMKGKEEDLPTILKITTVR